MDVELWHRSGHYDNYRENMYFTESGERQYAIRPMNCPGACLVFGAERHSYRELPLRIAEFGQVSRAEREGVLHGLLRVRAFTQDDAHIYCTPEQIVDEVTGICEAIDELYARFGFEDVRVELSTRPEKSIGSPTSSGSRPRRRCARRSRARGASTSSTPATAPSTGRRSTSTSPTRSAAPGSAAPARSTSSCPSASTSPTPTADDVQQRPVMIHRALLGSMERFAGILIEHYAGRFPVWLAPVQAIVLPVADRHVEYAERVERELREAGVRVAVDMRSESVGKKIRDAELGRYPYMLVVGDREQEAAAVAVRAHDEGELGEMPIAEFADVRASVSAADPLRTPALPHTARTCTYPSHS